MKNGFGITKGVNLGGWLSQCSGETEHLDTFIREEDIARIASWGMDPWTMTCSHGTTASTAWNRPSAGAARTG